MYRKIKPYTHTETTPEYTINKYKFYTCLLLTEIFSNQESGRCDPVFISPSGDCPFPWTSASTVSRSLVSSVTASSVLSHTLFTTLLKDSI